MTASINLYDSRWLARRQTQLPWAPLAVVGAAGAAALAVLAYNHWAQAGLQARLAAASADQARMTQGHTPGGDRNAALAALAEAAQRRENTLRQWRGVDAATLGGTGANGNANANANANANSAGPNTASASNVSSWFTTLSAVVQEGVWLTRVQADVGGGFRLEGRAQDGVALSSYLERWRSQPLLAGVALQTLEMKRAGADNAAGAAVAAATPAAQGIPATTPSSETELEFVLSNLAPGKSPGAGEAGATKPAGNLLSNAVGGPPTEVPVGTNTLPRNAPAP